MHRRYRLKNKLRHRSRLLLRVAAMGRPFESDGKKPGPPRASWQILKQSEILKDLGFSPTFVGFSYGAPLNEGALAGEVDVLFTADQPAIALCNRDNTWGMIGRLMYNRVGTFVPPDSDVKVRCGPEIEDHCDSVWRGGSP